MIDLVKKFFASRPAGNSGESSAEATHDIRVATCALFLEMARIDGEFSAAESEHVVSMLEEQYGLSGVHAAEITRSAEKELRGSVDLWRFTHLINQNYSTEEKIRIVELMWKLVYADGHLSEHENYLAHKLGKMLRLSHRELIDAKLAALHGDGR